MGDTMREAFEAWERETNSPVFLQRSDEDPDEYGNWIVQEQWASWQAAFERGRQLGMEQARRKPLTKAQIDFVLADSFLAANGSVYSTRVYDFVMAIEAAHGITTPPAGDSDTQSWKEET